MLAGYSNTRLNLGRVFACQQRAGCLVLFPRSNLSVHACCVRAASVSCVCILLLLQGVVGLVLRCAALADPHSLAWRVGSKYRHSSGTCSS